MNSDKKPIVLVAADFYLPGYKSGGGLRTLVNTVDRLSEYFDFRIICRDHDGKTDKTPYKDVKINDWNQINTAKVYFLSKENIRLFYLNNLINEINPQVIYANSCFSTLTIFVLMLKKLKRLKNIPLIIAPEGEISEGALSLKKTKKQIYTKFTKAINLYTGIIWKAACEEEVQEIKTFKGKGGKIFLAPNMPPATILPDYNQSEKPEKKRGELKLVYLSRIHPKKNLKFILELIRESGEKIDLDIYGPNDDPEYYDECADLIKQTGNKSQVRMMGEIPHHKVAETLFKYHFFVLPTLAENFGHVMVESFAAGTPCLISDRTPWRSLEEKGIGWDISLDEREIWNEKLMFCLNLDRSEFKILSQNSRKFAGEWLGNRKNVEKTKNVIDYASSKTLNNI